MAPGDLTPWGAGCNDWGMRFRLRTLHLLLLAFGLCLGVSLPIRQRYLHWKAVDAIRLEVERSLAAAAKDSATSPETALVDVKAIREAVVRSPVLNFDERQKLIVQVDRQLMKLRNELQQEAIRNTCYR
jgi:hypothetical protein